MDGVKVRFRQFHSQPVISNLKFPRLQRGDDGLGQTILIQLQLPPAFPQHQLFAFVIRDILRLAEQGFTLAVDDAALAQLAKDGYDPAFGARPVKRAIQRELENPIAKLIIAGKYLPGSEIKATARDGAIAVG